MRAIALFILAALGCSERALPRSGDLGAVDLASADRPVDLGSDGGCESNADCTRPSMFCLAPGEFAGCGICMPAPPCAADVDCAGDAGLGPFGGGHVCDDPRNYGQCGACSAVKVCLRGCVDSSGCVGGRVCASGHCVWKSCTTAEECGPNFGCADGVCERVGCNGDGACAGGFCVDGFCYPARGACMPVPV